MSQLLICIHGRKGSHEINMTGNQKDESVMAESRSALYRFPSGLIYIDIQRRASVIPISRKISHSFANRHNQICILYSSVTVAPAVCMQPFILVVKCQ